jgi:predicted O-methyltransferase YrrM
MAAALPRLAGRSEPSARALRRALATTAAGRLSAQERGWRERIEAKRSELVSDDAPTGPSFDPGSEGSHGRFTMERRETTVAVAVTLMSLTPPWCTLLLRLVRELGPRSCLELGTGFGMSAAYQAAGLELNGRGSLTTLEGSPDWGDRAARTLTELGLSAVELTSGPIAETLVPAAERLAPLDYVYIDAEHQAPATLRAFEALEPHLRDGALVVLDDADWPDMAEAHAAIGAHERVAHSLAVGRFGFAVIGGAAA